ncbi:hypothetical protein DIPPA_08680 [Diplonema papillatum]|nr:hypothetical protein DIPPA_08680 [Diplonema papillatum]
MRRTQRVLCFAAHPPAAGVADVGRAMLQRKRGRAAQAAARRDTAEAARGKVLPAVRVDFGAAAQLIHCEWPPGSPADAAADDALTNVQLLPNYVTPDEEGEILRTIEAHLGGEPWETAHADQLIRGYREKYVHRDLLTACIPLRRFYDFAAGISQPSEDLHFLEYTPEGYVRPHLDNPDNSSTFVAGLSLESPRVMYLTPKFATEGPDAQSMLPGRDYPFVSIVLPPRSVYVLTGACRYSWLHSIDYLPNDSVHLDDRLHFKGGVLEGEHRRSRKCVILRGAASGS